MHNEFNFYNIAAAGTVSLKTRTAQLHTVALNNNFTGTVVLYDTANGTPGTADTKIATIANPQGAATLHYECRTKKGLVAVATGTPNLTVTYI